MRLAALLGAAGAIAAVATFRVEAADFSYPPAAVGPPQYGVAAPPVCGGSRAGAGARCRLPLGCRSADIPAVLEEQAVNNCSGFCGGQNRCCLPFLPFLPSPDSPQLSAIHRDFIGAG